MVDMHAVAFLHLALALKRERARTICGCLSKLQYTVCPLKNAERGHGTQTKIEAVTEKWN